MGAPCSQRTQDWPLASPETSHSQCQVTPLGTAVPLAHSTSRRCHVEAAQRPCPPVCVTVKSTRLGKKKPLFCVGLKFPTWQACKVITKYYASPFQGQHYFSLAKRVRILGVPERPEVCLSAGAAWCAPAGCGEFTRDPRAPLPCHEEIQKLCSGRLLSVQTVVSLRRECFRVQLSLTSS